MRTKLKYMYMGLLSTLLFSACGEYDRIPATREIYVNESKATLLVGNKLQLKASPESAAFNWTSLNPSVAEVSATGEVTAVSPGSTDIIVTLADDSDILAVVTIVAREWIYLENIRTDNSSVTLNVGQTGTVLTTIEPLVITVPYDELKWESDNTGIATVSPIEGGASIKAVRKGTTIVRVFSGDVATEIAVTVNPTVQRIPTNQLSIAAVSDQTESDGGGATVIIQEFDPWMEQGRFWHSQWQDGAAPLPHWVIIDMGKERTVSSATVRRRFNNTDTKTVQTYTGNDPDPNATGWEFFGQNEFPNQWRWDWGNVWGDGIQYISADHVAANAQKGRYFKVVLPDSNNPPFTSVSQVMINEVIEEIDE